MLSQSILKPRIHGAYAPVRLGGSVIPEKGHICAFFSSADDEYRTLLPFMADGLEAGEAAFHTIDPARADDHLSRLVAAGIDVDAHRRSGQLELTTWDDVHLRGGQFDAEATS